MGNTKRYNSRIMRALVDFKTQAPFYSKPNFTIFSSGVALVLGVITVLGLDYLGNKFLRNPYFQDGANLPEEAQVIKRLMFDGTWQSFCIGIAFALAAALIHKALIRAREEHCVEYTLMTVRDKLKIPALKVMFTVGLPLILAPFAAAFLAYLVQIAPFPAFVVTGAFLFICYPDYKRVFRKAQEKAALVEADD
ncbi:MAG: hypothetical protein O3B01_21985 [Planctomycetota bacterium]|nr:hypothetical protein [Planctomycetota bacterium]MDA1141242.1 hypothetical protein [Planctomycetota bacterium]